MLKSLTALIALFVFAPAVASAQADFSRAPIKLGDKVHIVKIDGTEVSGHVTGFAADRLSINGYDFTPEPGLKIERSGDSVLNGVVWGAGVGVVMTLLACPNSTDYMGDCLAVGATIYGLLGALVDWARVGRTTLFRVPSGNLSVGTSVSPRGGVLNVRVSF